MFRLDMWRWRSDKRLHRVSLVLLCVILSVALSVPLYNALLSEEYYTASPLCCYVAASICSLAFPHTHSFIVEIQSLPLVCFNTSLLRVNSRIEPSSFQATPLLQLLRLQQVYANQAWPHIAALRKARVDIIIEIRWCAAHKGIMGNEKADEREKLAAAEPDGRGTGIGAARCLPLDLSPN